MTAITAGANPPVADTAGATPEAEPYQTAIDFLATRGIDLGLKVVAAIVAMVVGGFVVKLLLRFLGRALRSRRVDATLGSYLVTALGILLRALLVVAVLGIFGVETASFAAVFAAAGVAIGLAWSGLLSNLAAGISMVVLRPIHVGDEVRVAGVEGVVREIGLFVTIIDTADNVRTIIGNAKIFGETMANFSANPLRRVSVVAQLAHGVDYQRAVELLEARLLELPHVAAEPAPVVDFVATNVKGPVLCVRPFTTNEHYAEVLSAVNRLIREVIDETGGAAPETHLAPTSKAA